MILAWASPKFSDVNHLFFAQSSSDNAMSEFKVNFEWQEKHDL